MSGPLQEVNLLRLKELTGWWCQSLTGSWPLKAERIKRVWWCQSLTGSWSLQAERVNMVWWCQFLTGSPSLKAERVKRVWWCQFLTGSWSLTAERVNRVWQWWCQSLTGSWSVRLKELLGYDDVSFSQAVHLCRQKQLKGRCYHEFLIMLQVVNLSCRLKELNR